MKAKLHSVLRAKVYNPVRLTCQPCKMLTMTKRPQSLGEEIANSVSHGVALVAAVVSVPFLMASAGHQNSASFVGTMVFAATMVLLYLASTLYHAMPTGRAKRIFCKLDHGAIYLFIAGTYTPFALGALSGAWGWSLFGVVWLLAAIGITLKALDRLHKFDTSCT